jgi:hypothetical protein
MFFLPTINPYSVHVAICRITLLINPYFFMQDMKVKLHVVAYVAQGFIMHLHI